MNLCSYLRVSTDRQADDGYGIEIQRGAVEDWAGSTHHAVAAEFIDSGVSGTTPAEDRGGLSAALSAVEAGEFAGIVVARLDRIARRLHVQEATLAYVWRSGGRVFSTDTGEVHQDDADDPMRTALRQMAGVFGELERSLVTKRMRDGKRVKALSGGYCGGAPRFGTTVAAGSLVTEGSEVELIQVMADLRAQGAPFRSIAQSLNAMGAAGKHGGRWHAESVRRCLARFPCVSERESELPT